VVCDHEGLFTTRIQGGSPVPTHVLIKYGITGDVHVLSDGVIEAICLGAIVVAYEDDLEPAIVEISEVRTYTLDVNHRIEHL
jgi:hypothetical protein